jgi:ribosome-associated protein
MARKAVEVAADKQADDIVMLDIRGMSNFADYFVICSGETERQIETLRHEIDQALAKEGATLRHLEGSSDSGWVLLDFGDLIVHIFAPPERRYYQLEKLWGEAVPLVRIQ